MKISWGVSRLFLKLALCAVSLSTVSLCSAEVAAAGDRRAELILGDSIPFSYISSVGYDYFYTQPDNFIGFANDLGRKFDLDVVNAACPGETTGSFLSSTAPDNGCRLYRSLYPLHVGYGSTQAAFAAEYLKSHREVRLVTITLGGDDGLLLEAACASQPTPAQVAACIEAGLPALLTSVAENVGKILAGLRATGYAGAIVVTNYYSTDYSNAQTTALTAALNAAIVTPAGAYGAVVADVFTAFLAAASAPAFGGKTCSTGLLNPDVYTPFLCNVHPAHTGHRLIADTIALALKSWKPD